MGYNSSKKFFGYSLENDLLRIAVCLNGKKFIQYDAKKYGFDEITTSPHLITYDNEKTAFVLALDDFLLFPFQEYQTGSWYSEERVFFSPYNLEKFLNQIYRIHSEPFIQHCNFFSLNTGTKKNQLRHILIAKICNKKNRTQKSTYIAIFENTNDQYELEEITDHNLTAALSYNTFSYSHLTQSILAPTQSGYSRYTIANGVPDHEFLSLPKTIEHNYTIDNENSNLHPVALLPNEGQIVNMSATEHQYLYISKNKEYQLLGTPHTIPLPILSSCIRMNDEENLLAIPFILSENRYQIFIYKVRPN